MYECGIITPQMCQKSHLGLHTAVLTPPYSHRRVHQPPAHVDLAHVPVVAQVDEPLKVGLEAGGPALRLREDVVDWWRRGNQDGVELLTRAEGAQMVLQTDGGSAAESGRPKGELEVDLRGLEALLAAEHLARRARVTG